MSTKHFWSDQTIGYTKNIKITKMYMPLLKNDRIVIIIFSFYFVAKNAYLIKR